MASPLADSMSSSSASTFTCTASGVEGVPALTDPLRDFFCVITFDTITDPAELPCGHIFQHCALIRWLDRTRECPVCRQFASPVLITRSNFLRRHIAALIQHGQLTPRDPALDVVDEAPAVVMHNTDEMPPLIPAPTNVPPLIPAPTNTFSGYPNRPFTVVTNGSSNNNTTGLLQPMNASEVRDLFGYDLDEYQNSLDITPLRIFRPVLSLYVFDPNNLINPRASNRVLLRRLAEPSNHLFMVHRSLYDVPTNVYKYYYNHRGDVTSAIRSATLNGYFVYDMFEIRRGRFVLYSLQTRYNGSLHSLEPFN